MGLRTLGRIDHRWRPTNHPRVTLRTVARHSSLNRPLSNSPWSLQLKNRCRPTPRCSGRYPRVRAGSAAELTLRCATLGTSTPPTAEFEFLCWSPRIARWELGFGVPLLGALRLQAAVKAGCPLSPLHAHTGPFSAAAAQRAKVLTQLSRAISRGVIGGGSPVPGPHRPPLAVNESPSGDPPDRVPSLFAQQAAIQQSVVTSAQESVSPNPSLQRTLPGRSPGQRR